MGRSSHVGNLSRWGFTVVLMGLLPLSSSAQNRPLIEALPYVPDEIIVEMKTDDPSALLNPTLRAADPSLKRLNPQTLSGIRSLFPQANLRPTPALKQSGPVWMTPRISNPRLIRPFMNQTYIVKLKNNVDLKSMMAQLKKSPLVSQVSPNYIYKVKSVPNDPYYASSGSWGQVYEDLWGFMNMDLEAAWEITTGDSSMIVAVIDSGVDTSHPDIQQNIFINAAEQNGVTGVDDDANGYIDDISGYDFRNDDAVPNDDSGHGTHVAGTIAAKGNNGVGVTGVMWNAKILPLKVCSSGGVCDSTSINKAIKYAADMGASVINISLGRLGSSSSVEEAAINYAYQAGVVILAAAGNESVDAALSYPASYSRVISVGASTPNDTLSYFSNYGVGTDFLAPGGGEEGFPGSGKGFNILSLRASGTDLNGNLSTVLAGQYVRAQGTSMASPNAAGVVGLLLSDDPALTGEEIRQLLRMGADDLLATGWDGSSSFGRVNAFASLQMASACEARITAPNNLDSVTGNSFQVKGTAAGKSYGRYELKIARSVSGSLWQPVASSTSKITDSVLGTVNSTGYFGNYALHLKVFDGQGNKCGEDYKQFRASPTLSPKAVLKPVALNVRAGSALAAGDVNGDGKDDLLIGADGCGSFTDCRDSQYLGRAYLLFGNSTLSTLNLATSTEVKASWISTDIKDRLGVSLSIAKVDVDAYGDVVIGIPGYGTSAGKVCVFLGKNRAAWRLDMTHADADVCFNGEAAEDKLGFYVSNGGDVDGDGTHEIAITACGHDGAGNNFGKAYVLYGKDRASWGANNSISVAATQITGNVNMDFLCDGTTSVAPGIWSFGRGFPINGSGDVNGDGFDDIILGSPDSSNGGKAYLFLGQGGGIPSGSVTIADVTFLAPKDTLFEFGAQVGSAGDVNNDGFADVYIGKQGLEGWDSGFFSLVTGRAAFSKTFRVSTANSIHLPEGPSEGVGVSAFGTLGDVNGDDHDDFMIGAPRYLILTGMTHFFLGSDWQTKGAVQAASDFALGYNGRSDLFQFGQTIVGADIDGDGFKEVVIGAPTMGFSGVAVYDFASLTDRVGSVDNDWDGFTEVQGDCDDDVAHVYPGATEINDHYDNDCDGNIDDGSYFRDRDLDGVIAQEGDCDDANDKVYPGAAEICDGLDNDCDPATADGLAMPNRNSLCGPNTSTGECEYGNLQCVGGVSSCVGAVFPQLETCNFKDDDCDGNYDEDAKTVYYLDSDRDTYGTGSVTIQACTAPSSYVGRSGDCDDARNNQYPGAVEIAGDGIDQDCDGNDLPASVGGSSGSASGSSTGTGTSTSGGGTTDQGSEDTSTSTSSDTDQPMPSDSEDQTDDKEDNDDDKGNDKEGNDDDKGDDDDTEIIPEDDVSPPIPSSDDTPESQGGSSAGGGCQLNPNAGHGPSISLFIFMVLTMGVFRLHRRREF